MGLFGGFVPPLPPAGTIAFASEDRAVDWTRGWQLARWTIRCHKPGEDPTPACPRVGRTPPFTDQAEAYRYLDCLEKRLPYHYPAGAA